MVLNTTRASDTGVPPSLPSTSPQVTYTSTGHQVVMRPSPRTSQVSPSISLEYAFTKVFRAEMAVPALMSMSSRVTSKFVKARAVPVQVSTLSAISMATYW